MNCRVKYFESSWSCEWAKNTIKQNKKNTWKGYMNKKTKLWKDTEGTLRCGKNKVSFYQHKAWSGSEPE